MPDYKGHEGKSKALIQENGDVQNLLQKECGLSNSQISYIADCVGFHYELGKIRNKAKETYLGYFIAFAKSEQCKEACDEIASKFPEYKEEIGILFLCDSLAKPYASIIILIHKQLNIISSWMN